MLDTSMTVALIYDVCMHDCSVVKVNNLISQWQQMGVEAPHDTSLEDALTEVCYLSYTTHGSIT